MRVTTVASVTEQHIYFSKINESSYYEPYSIAYDNIGPRHALTIPVLHDISTASNETQQPTPTKHLPNCDIGQRNLSLHNAFDRYALIHPTIRSRNRLSALHSNDKQQNAVPDTYKAFSSKTIFIFI